MSTQPQPRALPELTKAEKDKVKQYVLQILNTKGLTGLAAGFTVVCAENMRLTKEINDLRSQLGIEPLPVYEPKL